MGILRQRRERVNKIEAKSKSKMKAGERMPKTTEIGGFKAPRHIEKGIVR